MATEDDLDAEGFKSYLLRPLRGLGLTDRHIYFGFSGLLATLVAVPRLALMDWVEVQERFTMTAIERFDRDFADIPCGATLRHPDTRHLMTKECPRPMISWTYNYHDYEEIVVHRDQWSFTSVTQFNPKGKCKIQGPSRAEAIQLLQGSDVYRRDITGEDVRAEYQLPPTPKGWVRFPPYNAVLSGFSQAGVSVRRWADFICLEIGEVTIEFPTLILPPTESVKSLVEGI